MQHFKIFSPDFLHQFFLRLLLGSVENGRITLNIVQWESIFVAASHQTGLDTISMTRRSIKVGIRGGGGRSRAEARALLNYDAARPPKGGPPDVRDLTASSLPLLDCPYQRESPWCRKPILWEGFKSDIDDTISDFFIPIYSSCQKIK